MFYYEGLMERWAFSKWKHAAKSAVINCHECDWGALKQVAMAYVLEPLGIVVISSQHQCLSPAAAF